MALTKISTGGVKDDAASQAKIADEAIDEARLQVSNAGSNGQFLSKQSGNTGGLTWATAITTIADDAIGQDQLAQNAVVADNLTEDCVTSAKIADGAVTEYRIGDNEVTEPKLKISNAGTNGQFLQKQSGNTGGLTWADVTIPPAGSTVSLVADGAIAAGKPVIITAAGKAKQAGETVSERSSQLSSPVQGNDGSHMSGDGSSAKTYKFNAITFSETSSTGGFFFRNYTTGNNLECRAFNLHSTTGNANIPSASDVTVLSDDYDQISACWEATNNKFIIVGKRDSDDKPYMTWTSVAANTITPSGNTTEISPGSTTDGVHPKCCDCGSGRVATLANVQWSSANIYRPGVKMFAYNSSSSNYDTGQFAWVSTDGDSSNPAEHGDLAYHASEGKLVAVWHTQANKVACKIGTISGSGTSTSVSFGSEVEVATAAELPKVVVDVNTGKVVVTYVYTSSNAPYSKVGTISGTSISFGTEALVDSGVVDANDPNNFRPELIYLKNLQKVVYGHTVLYGGQYYTVTRTGTVSGTSISWTNQFQHWPNGTGIRGITMVGLNDASTHKFVIGGRNDGYSDRGVFKTVALSDAVTNVTYLNTIGFAPSAINDTATGTIHLDGNTVDNQSSLTPATRYYVQGDGSLGTSQAQVGGTAVKSGGIALSSTKLLIRASYAE